MFKIHARREYYRTIAPSVLYIKQFSINRYEAVKLKKEINFKLTEQYLKNGNGSGKGKQKYF